MGRDNEITVYVSDETKQDIKQRADDEDKTISTYVDGVLRRYFIMEDEEQVATETRAEQRLEELIALGKDELQETAQEIAEMNTKMGGLRGGELRTHETRLPRGQTSRCALYWGSAYPYSDYRRPRRPRHRHRDRTGRWRRCSSRQQC